MSSTSSTSAVFQFPSNGKVYSESPIRYANIQREHNSFNSLQTGKCIQSNWKAREPFIEYLQFQFPSNGKVYSEGFIMTTRTMKRRVSIPFKRESVFRADNGDHHIGDDFEFQFPSNGKVYSETYPPNTRKTFSHHSFNSLQTGKCIQRGNFDNDYADDWIRFQFPSNGKVYSESL